MWGGLLEEVVRARATAAAVAVQNTALRAEVHRLAGTTLNPAIIRGSGVGSRLYAIGCAVRRTMLFALRSTASQGSQVPTLSAS